MYCTRDWVGDEPFLILLGDHIYASNSTVPCARQLIEAFHAVNGQQSVVAVYQAAGEEVSHYGTITGTWTNEEHTILNVAEFAEKPSLDYAQHNLVTDGLPDDAFLCVYGQYILTPNIFEHLDRQIRTDDRQAGEIQLTTALETLRHEEGMLAFLVDGDHYDTGLPINYLRSLVSYYERGGKEVRST